jgi:hypothetical protein
MWIVYVVVILLAAFAGFVLGIVYDQEWKDRW